MKKSTEILMYMQKLKYFIENDEESYTYFLLNTDKEKFFIELEKIATNNFTIKGEPMLTESQLELVRKSCELPLNNVKTDLSEVYMDLGDMGKLYMN